MCTSPDGYKSGMKLYYTHCTGPGSKAYWEAGSNRGSLIYWTAGTQRSIAPDWVGPCMTGLDTVWCKQMRADQLLQNTSILDWLFDPQPAENQVAENQPPCDNLRAISPNQQESLHILINASMQATGQIFDSAYDSTP